MHSRRLSLLLGALALSTPALALAQDEDDAPIAYPEDDPSEDAPRKLPRRSEDPTADFDRMRDDDEAEGDFERLAGDDDPNKGLAGELILGAMLLDSSQGKFADATVGVGLRFTWEFGRLLNNEPLRETVWADVRWMTAGLSNGTELIHGSSRSHYFSVAPAYEYVFGEAKKFGIFGQLGGGFAFQTTSLTIGEEITPIKGMKPLLQYGIGFRGRPRLNEKVSLSFRFELMRFRRGYLDDTFLGGSVGTAF
ncbi:hypothetical protein [Hyalangium versicolor]|uniref:hypothetical protein n=1 Tax=Hyalangium versicolor TaxID=2861190 RepID=UPI001CCFE6BE|nr:hypothetical protein [Hyalangium versicolor]